MFFNVFNTNQTVKMMKQVPFVDKIKLTNKTNKNDNFHTFPSVTLFSIILKKKNNNDYIFFLMRTDNKQHQANSSTCHHSNVSLIHMNMKQKLSCTVTITTIIKLSLKYLQKYFHKVQTYLLKIHKCRSQISLSKSMD